MSDGADFNGLPEFGDYMKLEKNSEKMENWGGQHWTARFSKESGWEFSSVILFWPFCEIRTLSFSTKPGP
jgi:hypothetical protein